MTKERSASDATNEISGTEAEEAKEVSTVSCGKRSTRHQLHLLISEADRQFLRRESEAADEPIARTVRRMIRRIRTERESLKPGIRF